MRSRTEIGCRRLSLCLTGILAAGSIAASGAGAHHAPGHTGGGGNQPAPALSLTATPNPLVYGGLTTLSGRLTGLNQAGGQRVDVQHNPFPFSLGFGPLTSALTASNGTYGTLLKPTQHSVYRSRSGATTSPEVQVNVRVSASFNVSDSTPSRRQLVRFYGVSAPAHDGSLVRFQRRDASGVFRTVATTTLLDTGRNYPRYRRFLRVSRDGVYRVRVSAGDLNHWPNNSRTRFLDVP